jgi:signal transduction histidine kinase
VEQYNENQNLKSKTITDIKIDKKQQIWVVNNYAVQYFDGLRFSEPLKANNSVWRLFLADSCTFLYSSNFNELEYLNVAKRKILPHNEGISVRSDYLLSSVNTDSSIIKLYFNKNTHKYELRETRKINPYILVKDTLNYTDYCNGDFRKIVIKDVHKNLTSFTVYKNEILYIDQTNQICAYNVVSNQIKKLNVYLAYPRFPIRLSHTLNNDGQILLAAGKQIFLFTSELSLIAEIRNLNGNLITKSVTFNTIAADKYNNIYAGSLTDGLFKINLNTPQLRTFQDDNLGKGKFVKSILPDKKYNRILASTWEDGIFIYDTNGVVLHKITNINGEDKLPLIAHITKLKDNEYLLFAPFTNKVYKLKFQNKKYSIALFKNNVNLNFVCSEQPYSDNKVIIGSGSIHLLDRETEKLTMINTKELIYSTLLCNGKYYSTSNSYIFIQDALTHKTIQTLKPKQKNMFKFLERNDTTLYLASQQGLFIFNTLNNSISSDPLLSTTIYSMIYDKEGKLWLGTGSGIYCLHKDKILHHLTPSHGLQDWEFNSNSCNLSDDGELFFGGIYGANSFYPAAIDVKDSIQFFLDGLYSKEKSLNHRLVDGDKIKFTQGSHLINLKIKVESSLNEDLYNRQFAIDDGPWIDINKQSIISQVFTPGSYRLYYHVGKDFDTRARRIKYIDIEIYKPFYLYSLFWGIISILTAIGIVIVFRRIDKLVLQNTQAKFEAKEQLNKEKSRISMELHDTIGAQISIISRNLSFMEENLDSFNKKELKSKLEQLNSLSAKTNNDLRDSIWATKKEKITLEDFIKRVQGFIYHLSDFNVSCEYNVLGNEKFLNSYHAINLLRIVQEGIINALKYSKANKVKVSINHLNNKIEIEIIDDGIGFNIGESYEKGNGLTNMEDRANDINYDFFILSSPNNGCTITLKEK